VDFDFIVEFVEAGSVSSNRAAVAVGFDVVAASSSWAPSTSLLPLLLNLLSIL
jgi:hypothetical protein